MRSSWNLRLSMRRQVQVRFDDVHGQVKGQKPCIFVGVPWDIMIHDCIGGLCFQAWCQSARCLVCMLPKVHGARSILWVTLGCPPLGGVKQCYFPIVQHSMVLHSDDAGPSENRDR
jgi:hypothetical protein